MSLPTNLLTIENTLRDLYSQKRPHSLVWRIELIIVGHPWQPALLDELEIFPKFVWKSRFAQAPLAGIGQVLSGGLEEMQAVLEQAEEGTCLFGGMRFDSARPPSEEWEDFPEELFFIPQWEITPVAEGLRLALHGKHGEGLPPNMADFLTTLFPETHKQPHQISTEPAVAVTRSDRPGFQDWSNAVDSALQEISNGHFEKVVLARESRLQFLSPVAPFQFFEKLTSSASRCFHFCIQPTASSGAFLGVSPELLVRRQGRTIESEAIAGTRPRSLDMAEDLRLERQLLEVPKERHEHQVVVDALERTFAHFCTHHEVSAQPQVLKLARLQHLQTGITGELRPSVSDATILAHLHPTPATCGRPSDAALRFLRNTETFDRGWYAGPIGMVSKTTAEFAVAIRSIHIRNLDMDVFAGAGIVDASNAENEWAELECKISAPLHLLNL